MTKVLLGVATVTVLAAILVAGRPANKARKDRQRTEVQEKVAKLPITFVENRGQVNRNVRYFARGPHYAFFLTPNEIVLSLARKYWCL